MSQLSRRLNNDLFTEATASAGHPVLNLGEEMGVRLYPWDNGTMGIEGALEGGIRNRSADAVGPQLLPWEDIQHEARHLPWLL